MYVLKISPIWLISVLRSLGCFLASRKLTLKLARKLVRARTDIWTYSYTAIECDNVLILPINGGCCRVGLEFDSLAVTQVTIYLNAITLTKTSLIFQNNILRERVTLQNVVVNARVYILSYPMIKIYNMSEFTNRSVGSSSLSTHTIVTVVMLASSSHFCGSSG
jgi:hypothetical protein